MISGRHHRPHLAQHADGDEVGDEDLGAEQRQLRAADEGLDHADQEADQRRRSAARRRRPAARRARSRGRASAPGRARAARSAMRRLADEARASSAAAASAAVTPAPSRSTRPARGRGRARDARARPWRGCTRRTAPAGRSPGVDLQALRRASSTDPHQEARQDRIPVAQRRPPRPAACSRACGAAVARANAARRGGPCSITQSPASRSTSSRTVVDERRHRCPAIVHQSAPEVNLPPSLPPSAREPAFATPRLSRRLSAEQLALAIEYRSVLCASCHPRRVPRAELRMRRFPGWIVPMLLLAACAGGADGNEPHGARRARRPWGSGRWPS